MKDMEKYIGKKTVVSVVKKVKTSRERFQSLRESLKVLEVSVSRDLSEAEKFEQLTRAYEERMKKLEETVTTLKVSTVKDMTVARRNLDLIQV